jgi:hypothetical protein
MAVLAIFYGKGLSKEGYEALRKEVKWETDLAAGGVFHACAFDDQGDAHVADVWTSAEEMNAFVTNRLMPAMQKLNIPPPSVEVYPAYNVNVYPNAMQYLLK